MTPQFRWWGQWEQPIVSKLRGTFALMDQEAPGLVPLIAVFGHEHGCGPNNTGGGPSADDRYQRWIQGVAKGIGSREAVIAYEPDSLGTIECLAKNRRESRVRLLAYGVKVLSKLPATTVYIDAGASDWQDVPTIARKLRAIGVSRVRGFMLNATHQATTRSSIRYGLSLSRRLGGKHFIIGTSHNGDGPDNRLPYASRWCNPPNAAAGALPTTGPPTQKWTPTCGWSAPDSRTAPATAGRPPGMVGKTSRANGRTRPLVVTARQHALIRSAVGVFAAIEPGRAGALPASAGWCPMAPKTARSMGRPATTTVGHSDPGGGMLIRPSLGSAQPRVVS